MKMIIYNTRRKMWTFKPVTRIKYSSRLYNRKQKHLQQVDECTSDA
jgi:hypothetical protein